MHTTVQTKTESTKNIVVTVIPKVGCDTISVKNGEKEFDFNINPKFPKNIIKDMVLEFLTADQKMIPIIIEDRRVAMTA